MINFFEAIILGVIQGITEFLPISSSGHLIIGRTFFEIDSSGTGSFIEVFYMVVHCYQFYFLEKRFIRFFQNDCKR